jgi:23S rRNA (cytosine1962-C5)-methyltransferase
MQTLTPDWSDYELVDSGAGKKLERFGEFTLIRPEPQAKWLESLKPQRWESANGEFLRTGGVKKGQWKFRKPTPDRWPMQRKNLKFWVQPAPSGHVGVFPDQAVHWDWIENVAKLAAAPIKVLSLFGHTGLATLAAAAAGAEVTHVDASRKAVALARENQSLSNLGQHPIRWIVEDALTFVRREARRGNQYHAMILDPPRFGRGPDGEIWKLDDSLPELLSACAKTLTASPAFILLNVYSTVLTHSRIAKEAAALHSHLKQMLGDSALTVSSGELTLSDSAQRKVSASVFARAQQFNSSPQP